MINPYTILLNDISYNDEKGKRVHGLFWWNFLMLMTSGVKVIIIKKFCIFLLMLQCNVSDYTCNNRLG